MGREIKFRAWDKKSKTMREVDSIAFHNRQGVFDFNDSNLPKVVNVWGMDCIEQKSIILHREKEQVELMQYTGLKDRNGKEIYEGDIVKSFGNIGIVEWLNGHYEVEWGEFTSYLWQCSKETIEVIGNIHEDPELLEAK